MAKLKLLHRDAAFTTLYDRAVRVTFKALALKSMARDFLNNLYDQGYFVGSVDAEAIEVLSKKYDSEDNPVVGNAMIFRPGYAEAFLLVQLEGYPLNKEKTQAVLEQQIDAFYASGGVLGFLGEKMRERGIEQLKTVSMEATWNLEKKHGSASPDVVGSSGNPSGAANAAAEPSAGAAPGVPGGWNSDQYGSAIHPEPAPGTGANPRAI